MLTSGKVLAQRHRLVRRGRALALVGDIATLDPGWQTGNVGAAPRDGEVPWPAGKVHLGCRRRALSSRSCVCRGAMQSMRQGRLQCASAAGAGEGGSLVG